MKNSRLLYLVQHTNKSMFKIGIATDKARFKQLDKDYKIDWDSSLFFEGENEDICKMEKILHGMFQKKRLGHQGGTGGTEWFSSGCLTNVVEAILFNVNNSNMDIDLKFQNIDLNVKNVTNGSISKVKKFTVSNRPDFTDFKKFREAILKNEIQTLDGLYENKSKKQFKSLKYFLNDSNLFKV